MEVTPRPQNFQTTFSEPARPKFYAEAPPSPPKPSINLKQTEVVRIETRPISKQKSLEYLRDEVNRVELEDLRIREKVNADQLDMDRLKRESFSDYRRKREIQIEGGDTRLRNTRYDILDDEIRHQANRERWSKGLSRPRNLRTGDPFRIKVPTEAKWKSLAPGLKFPKKIPGLNTIADLAGDLLFPEAVANGEIPDFIRDQPPEEISENVPDGLQSSRYGTFYFELGDPFKMARNRSKVFQDQPKSPETYISSQYVTSYIVSVRSSVADKEVVYDEYEWGYDVIGLIDTVGRTYGIHGSSVARLFERFIFFVPDGVSAPTFSPDGTVQLPNTGIDPINFSPDFPLEFRPNPTNIKKPDWRPKDKPGYPSVQFKPWDDPARPPSMKPEEPKPKPDPRANPENNPTFPPVREFPKIDQPGTRIPIFTPDERFTKQPDRITTRPTSEPALRPTSPTVTVPRTTVNPSPTTTLPPATFTRLKPKPKNRDQPTIIYTYPGDEDMPCSECRFNPAVIKKIVDDSRALTYTKMDNNSRTTNQKIDDLKTWITEHFQAVVDAFTVEWSSSFSRKRKCDDEITQLSYKGTGFKGVYDALEKFAKYIDPVMDKSCDSAIASIPEWWAVRIGADRPQMVIQWADKENGKVGRSRWSTSIPHYNKGKSPITLPDYQKGSYMATVILKDNSKLVINAANKGEADKMINAMVPMIDPAFVPSPMQVQYGERKGQALSNKTVTATIAQFYSKGQLDTAADFEIDCNK